MQRGEKRGWCAGCEQSWGSRQSTGCEQSKDCKQGRDRKQSRDRKRSKDCKPSEDRKQSKDRKQSRPSSCEGDSLFFVRLGMPLLTKQHTFQDFENRANWYFDDLTYISTRQMYVNPVCWRWVSTRST